MLESKHRRGPFDHRYPARAVAATPVWELPLAPDPPPRLAWAPFARRFYPGRHRHHFEALASYAAYGRAHELAGRESVVSPPVLGEWESEGGRLAPLERGRSEPRRSPAPV